MAAANWVCIVLLLSLCLGMCYGNRVGLSTTDKDAKELVILNQGNDISDSTHQCTGDEDGDHCWDSICEDKDNCSGDHDIDIFGGCDHGCTCVGQGDVVNTIGNLAQRIVELAKKLEGNCLGQNYPMNKDAMAPESG